MIKLIECRKLTKSFARKNAIENLDLLIEPGRTLGLVGPNGAGKTTLFSLISGYFPRQGRFAVAGRDRSSRSLQELTIPPDISITDTAEAA